jgi:hypothetical protein
MHGERVSSTVKGRRKMTSRFALLTAMAGIIGFGCSGDDGTTPPQPPPPTAKPAFATGAAQPAGTLPAQNTNANTNTNTQTPVASGGTGGVSGAAGSAGTASAAAGSAGTGAGGAPATGTMIPVGTGNAITPVAGHVAGTSNGAGIQGDFFTFSDADGTPAGTTTITPKPNFAMSMGSTICASGSASQILTPAGATDPAYGQYYGGGIGLTLADPGGGVGAQPWTQGKVVGFSFNLTGTTIPTALRFQAQFFDGSTVGKDPYCTTAVKAGANTIMLNSLLLGCYNTPPGAPLPTAALLQAIQWQVVTSVTAATPFNFCVEALTAIVSP